MRVYHIFKMRNRRRYSVSTKCSTLPAAMKEYERFEKDPDNYVPAGGEERVLLTDKLIGEYVSYHLDDKGNTPDWAAKQRSYLKWWKAPRREASGEGQASGLQTAELTGPPPSTR